jgi:hypothetical protein
MTAKAVHIGAVLVLIPLCTFLFTSREWSIALVPAVFWALGAAQWLCLSDTDDDDRLSLNSEVFDAATGRQRSFKDSLPPPRRESKAPPGPARAAEGVEMTPPKSATPRSARAGNDDTDV